MYQDLSIAIDALVELFVSVWCLVDSDLVRHNERWFCPSSNDEVTEVAVICLDVALASSKRQSLFITVFSMSPILISNMVATYLLEELAER